MSYSIEILFVRRSSLCPLQRGLIYFKAQDVQRELALFERDRTAQRQIRIQTAAKALTAAVPDLRLIIRPVQKILTVQHRPQIGAVVLPAQTRLP